VNLIARSSTTAVTLLILAAPGYPATRGVSTASPDGDRPVEAQLQQLEEESDKSTPPAVLEAGRKGTAELVQNRIIDLALQVGDTVPTFKLSNARGETVSSLDLLSKGPIVLVFYRGAWCPFCNLYLRSLQRYVPQFEKHGASLVAISGENPDNTLTVEQKNELTYTVLSDPGFNVARDFGVVYEMPTVTNDAILELGFDLSQYYGTDKAELPLSATYVIDQDGKIVYAFLDPDYKRRAEPADLLEALSDLG
jgi:peroxiredoxin